MKYKIAFTAILLSLLFNLNSCRFGVLGCIRGTGPTVTATRSISNFSGLRLETDATVFVIADSVTSVSIDGQQNIIDNLNMFVAGNDLVIRNQRCVSNSSNLSITIHCPNVSDITLSGSGTINYYPNTKSVTDADFHVSGSGNLNVLNPLNCNRMNVKVSGSGRIDMNTNCPELSAKISGSGRITAYGTSDRSSVDISGSGRWSGFDLSSKDVTVSISGSGRAEVNCSNILDVNISGSGKVTYRGNPTVKSRITGSGSVNHE